MVRRCAQVVKGPDSRAGSRAKAPPCSRQFSGSALSRGPSPIASQLPPFPLRHSAPHTQLGRAGQRERLTLFDDRTRAAELAGRTIRLAPLDKEQVGICTGARCPGHPPWPSPVEFAHLIRCGANVAAFGPVHTNTPGLQHEGVREDRCDREVNLPVARRMLFAELSAIRAGVMDVAGADASSRVGQLVDSWIQRSGCSHLEVQGPGAGVAVRRWLF